MQPIIRQILDAFKRRGSERYGQEGVTQLEHALQCAQLAVRANSDAPLVAAALLHDVGHILENDEASTPGDETSREEPNHANAGREENLDDQHESRGYHFLAQHFGDAVADPVRLHVIAKRYLCTKRPEYASKLSPTSLQSFHDQGGTMSPQELAQFEAEPYYSQALELRHWDDAAKDANAAPPAIEEFVAHLQSSLK